MTSGSYRVQVAVDLLKKHEIENIIFSPGSRNAPLVIGFNGDEYFHTKSLVDERSAAFFALGMAQQIRKPVVLCSTSGSAVLNYAPAIAEAFYQKIPLIIITADRPPEWIDHGEGQSMRQYKVYENYIAESFNLPMLDHPDALWQTGVMINEAVHISNQQSKPVHINFPFREPLYETVNKATKSQKKIIHHQTHQLLNKDEMLGLKKSWYNSNKKMIICGSMNSNKELNHLLREINKDSSVSVLTETTSNLYDDLFIGCIDRTLERVNDHSFYPEIVITIGNSIISKKLKKILRKNKPIEHWHIEKTNRAQDIFTSLTNFIPLEPDLFFSDFMLNYQKKENSNFSNLWYNEFKKGEENHKNYLSNCRWSDLKVHELIQEKISTQKLNLQMGNSTSVRYVQLFKHLEMVKYNSNRGISGIDGSSSTASGAASINKENTVLLTGDLGFIYDQNALWNNNLSKKLKIIVINNQGGGIFKIIPGPSKTPYLNEFFETSHNLNIEKISSGFGVNYKKVDNIKEAESAIEDLLASNHSEILELFTGNVNNEEILFEYFDNIKK
ncbi:MAG: 2-succinyl-5-enolpyruvyl-6-hydroxy-3-cyclohexene-1-carboxylic-acid synthase [Crocinitomicaceae bacterium]|nr:2-succinyl-5-enolpyruvyl-6-hydroxy-3-cyclohexene-1-carboxylic-acid synthase [Crocinitomicaceae bacterium]